MNRNSWKIDEKKKIIIINEKQNLNESMNEWD